MRYPSLICKGAFTLVEMMMAMACGSFILASVLTAGTALQRSFMAVQGYSMAEGDQLRVSDYIALDCRRAISAAVANNILTLTIPQYYDTSGNPVTPTFDSNGNIQYGTGTVTVSYYSQNSNFMRDVTTSGVSASTSSKVIASNVDSFTVSPQDLNSSVTCTITFAPRFKSLTDPGPINGTTVYSSTFLRNAAARQ
ncbi:MAG TPA: prepilin-type N-terminal cleavage/methylation domain-containing protein [Chthoniobacterales bacterium]